MIRDNIYQIALKYIGTKESPRGSNKVVFNRDYYGKDVSAPWCCAFVWDVYRMAKASAYFYGGGKTASCTTLLNWYRKNRNKWVHKDITRLKRGDLVFYQFDKDDNADHIGIFEKIIDGKNFYAIEGNTSSGNAGSQDNGDGVYRRKRPMSKVMAFVSIEFEDDTKKDTNPYPEPTKTVYRKAINIPNDDTRWVQWELVECGYKLDIDGKFGVQTENTVKNFQKYHGLEIDGRVGPVTRSELKK